MPAKIKRLFFFVLLCSVPFIARSEIIIIENVSVEVQDLKGDSYRLLFNFALPALPDGINIDRAVISFGVNITANSGNINLFEILAAGANGEIAGTSYNQNPVTGRIGRNKLGLTQIDLDITQLVDSWVNGTIKNDGVFVVSHRRIPEKILQKDKIDLAPEFKQATVKLFYTALE